MLSHTRWCDITKRWQVLCFDDCTQTGLLFNLFLGTTRILSILCVGLMNKVIWMALDAEFSGKQTTPQKSLIQLCCVLSSFFLLLNKWNNYSGLFLCVWMFRKQSAISLVKWCPYMVSYWINSQEHMGTFFKAFIRKCISNMQCLMECWQ